MNYPKTSWLIGLGLLAVALGACAGKLDQPERFASAVRKYQGGGGADGGAAPSSPSGPSDEADAGAEDVASTEPPDCVLEVFHDSCALAGCHTEGLPQVDLASDGVAERLIDQASDSKMCKGFTFIATDGSSSLLLDKLTAPPPCGAKMPLTGTLSAASRQCLTDWVSSLSGTEPSAGDESDAGAEP